MIALSAVQSSAPKFIHNVILSIDTSDNAWYNQVHFLIERPYLWIIASNAIKLLEVVYGQRLRGFNN